MALAARPSLSPSEALHATPPKLKLGDVFGHVDTLAGLLRQIGHDERVHKLESLHEAARAARRSST
jgi:hypothetical protein